MAAPVLVGTATVLLHGAAVVLLAVAWRDPDFLPRPAP